MNVDIPGAAQVRIDWGMVVERDDNCFDSPLDRQDGFFPSRDPKDAGYMGDVTDEEFQADHDRAQDLLDGWHNGDWYYVGIIAKATVYIPIGHESYAIHEFTSGGLWGIESYVADYHNEVFEEEKAELLDELKTLGHALISGDYKSA